MSYTQGTQVRLDVSITDTDSGLTIDPATLVCRVQDPLGNVTDQTLTSGVLKLEAGQYRALVDTTPASQVWLYEWIADNESIAKGQFNVRSAIPAPA